MDTDKKPDGETTDQPKPSIGDAVGDLIVSGATVLANTAAKAVVNRVKKAAATSAPVKAVAKAVKKAKKSAAGIKAAKTKKAKKAKKAAKKSGAKKSPGKKAVKKSAKKAAKKNSYQEESGERSPNADGNTTPPKSLARSSSNPPLGTACANRRGSRRRGRVPRFPAMTSSPQPECRGWRVFPA